jgi:hypothetical protein
MLGCLVVVDVYRYGVTWGESERGRRRRQSRAALVEMYKKATNVLLAPAARLYLRLATSTLLTLLVIPPCRRRLLLQQADPARRHVGHKPLLLHSSQGSVTVNNQHSLTSLPRPSC